MPLDVFEPALNPSTPSTKDVNPRVNTAKFGDGYSQRSEDGLNSSEETFQAQWQSLRSSDADTMEAFFRAHKSTPFLWTVPLESVQRKWVAAKWSRGYVGGDTVSLSATFTEVFDL